jgi:hypothetical protein
MNTEINIHDLPRIKMEVLLHKLDSRTRRPRKDGVYCYVYDMESDTIVVYASIKKISEELNIKYQTLRKHLKKKDNAILNSRYQIQYRYNHIPIWRKKDGSLFTIEHIYP